MNISRPNLYPKKIGNFLFESETIELHFWDILTLQNNNYSLILMKRLQVAKSQLEFRKLSFVISHNSHSV